MLEQGDPEAGPQANPKRKKKGRQGARSAPAEAVLSVSSIVLGAGRPLVEILHGAGGPGLAGLLCVSPVQNASCLEAGAPRKRFLETFARFSTQVNTWREESPMPPAVDAPAVEMRLAEFLPGHEGAPLDQERLLDFCEKMINFQRRTLSIGGQTMEEC